MMEHINTAANFAAFIIIVILSVGTVLGGDLKKRVFRWFSALLLMTLVCILGDALLVLLMGPPGKAAYTAMRVTDFLNFLIVGFALVAAGMYFYEFLSTKTRISLIFVHI